MNWKAAFTRPAIAGIAAVAVLSSAGQSAGAQLKRLTIGTNPSGST